MLVDYLRFESTYHQSNSIKCMAQPPNPCANILRIRSPPAPPLSFKKPHRTCILRRPTTRVSQNKMRSNDRSHQRFTADDEADPPSGSVEELADGNSGECMGSDLGGKGGYAGVWVCGSRW